MHDFDRPTLKQESKQTLRQYSPSIYLISLIYFVLTTLPSLVMQRSLYPALLDAGPDVDAMAAAYQNWAVNNSGTALTLATWAMDIFMAIVAFGFIRCCLIAARGQELGGVATLFSGFSQFWRVFCLALLRAVYITLWSMLFVVPGIIKAISYSQSERILLDNPDLSANDCITMSRQLMLGHKGTWLLLQLSFLGWQILSGLTAGLLGIWLLPYQEITNAGFYNRLVEWQPDAPADEEPPADDRPHVDDYWKS